MQSNLDHRFFDEKSVISNDDNEVDDDCIGEWTEDAWGDEAPLPLVSAPSDIERYPLECLGELAKIVEDLADGLQISVSLAAQSILAAVSVAAQHKISVHTHLGAIYPVSLFMLTFTEPGSRKDIVDRIAFSSVIEFEKNQRIIVLKEIDRLEQAETRLSDQIKGEMHANYTHIIDNSPMEFIFDAIASGSKSLIYSDGDITQLFGRAGTKSKGNLGQGRYISKLWENPFIQLKNGKKASINSNCYLSINLMCQREFTDQIVEAEVFRNSQAILSKFLITRPENLMGLRMDVGFDPLSVSSLAVFNERLTSLISKPARSSFTGRDTPPIKIMKIDHDAEYTFMQFVGDVERHSVNDGYYQSIKSFAARCAEHILKLAGIMTIYEDPSANSISVDQIIRAQYLFNYYAGEYKQISEQCHKTNELSKAQKLLLWLEKQAQIRMSHDIKYRFVLQNTHPEFRTVKELDIHLKILIEHRFIRVDSNRNLIRLRSKPGVRFVGSSPSQLS